jgi:hypothetical protein
VLTDMGFASTHCMLRMVLAGPHLPCTSGPWGMRRRCWARQAEGRTQQRILQDRQVGGHAAAWVTSCLPGCMGLDLAVYCAAAAGCGAPGLSCMPLC